MDLIYAEKPDMAEKIASALGGSSFRKSDKKQGFYEIKIDGKPYKVTWGYGHLCALADAQDYDPAYKNWGKMPIPFIPDDFKIVLNERSKMPVKQTYSVVRRLLKEADRVINATDYDREGELIFHYLYVYSGCSKEVKRMKLSSTTKTGIRDAFDSLADDSEVRAIRESAKCRSIADWVVGCNLTAAMTLKAGGRGVVSVGRVQTPTLAMIVARDEAIENFRPEDYFTVDALFRTEAGETYKGTHKTKRFSSRADAEAVLAKCRGADGIVSKTEKTKKKRPVPNLYSLDSLQMDANSRHGFSLKKTLDLTQKLYEKGYVTYPRTDCQYLPDDMFPQIRKVQEMLRNEGFSDMFKPDAKEENMRRNRRRFFDDSKLGSHYAIIPTDSAPTDMTPDEAKVYRLIAASVVRMLYPDAVAENAKILTDVNGETFVSSGTAIAEKGWMQVDWDAKEELLPSVKEGDKVSAKCSMTAKKTEPPKRYTEKTLLAAMISAGKSLEDDELREFMAKESIDGIGTVATRAGIVETLIARGVAARDGKSIVSTPKGRELIRIIPVEDVKSAAMTAKYERKLNLIVKGEQNPEKFLDEIYESVGKWCGEIRNLSDERVRKMEDSGNTGMKCPACGRPLREMSWGYGCTGYSEGCRFSVGTICEKKLTERQVKTLLEKGEVGPISGFVSKRTGKKFDAKLKLEKEEVDGKTECRISFAFEDKPSKQDEMPELYAKCPECGARIVKGRWGWECEDKCGVSVPYVLCGKTLSQADAEALLSHGSTAVLEGFTSKKGNPFNAALRMTGGKITFEFPEKQS